MKSPIEPVAFSYGATVVDIGDLRIARGMSRRPHSSCKHKQLVYDLTERRVWCSDCESDIEPFDAFKQLVDSHHHLEAKAARIRQDALHTITSRAGKVMDEVWRSRSMTPCCPHCKQAIMPEDVVNGVGLANKDMERRRRDRAAKEKS